MKRLSFALLACLAVGQVAQAELIATFGKNEAVYGAGINTWALGVTTTTDWQAAEININLTAGNLLNVPEGFPSGPKPTFAAPGDSGVFTPGFAEPPIIAPGAISNATQFSASWSNTGANDVGTFDIGAFSFSDNATGTLTGRIVAKNLSDPINGIVYNLVDFTIANGAITAVTTNPVPDLGLMATNGAGLSAALQGVWNSKVSGTSISLIDGLMITNDDPNSDDITELGAIGSSVEITNYAGQGVIGTVSAGTVPGKYSLLLTGPFQDFDPSVPLTGTVNFTSANGGNASLAFSVAVPEPSTVALSALALVGLVGFARRKK